MKPKLVSIRVTTRKISRLALRRPVRTPAGFAFSRQRLRRSFALARIAGIDVPSHAGAQKCIVLLDDVHADWAFLLRASFMRTA